MNETNQIKNKKQYTPAKINFNKRIKKMANFENNNVAVVGNIKVKLKFWLYRLPKHNVKLSISLILTKVDCFRWLETVQNLCMVKAIVEIFLGQMKEWFQAIDWLVVVHEEALNLIKEYHQIFLHEIKFEQFLKAQTKVLGLILTIQSKKLTFWIFLIDLFRNISTLRTNILKATKMSDFVKLKKQVDMMANYSTDEYCPPRNPSPSF